MKKTFNIKKHNIREICLEADDQFKTWNITEDDRYDMVLAIEEALTNIYEHGYSKSADSCCPVNIEIFEGISKVYIIIADSARYFSIDACKSVDTSTYVSSATIGGFGVTIIKKMMNEVTLFPLFEENVLVMGKNIKYQSGKSDGDSGKNNNSQLAC